MGRKRIVIPGQHRQMDAQAARLEQLHRSTHAAAGAALNAFNAVMLAFEAGSGPGAGVASLALTAAQSIAAMVAGKLQKQDPVAFAAMTRDDEPLARFWAAAYELSQETEQEGEPS